MIVYSKQHKIIQDISLSFQKLERLFVKQNEKTLQRDLIFYKPKKYETYTEIDFKFIVLWTVFKSNTNKIDTLKIMNQYTLDDIKAINKEKEKIVLYKNTLSNDSKILNTLNKSTDIIELYKKNIISLLSVYMLYNNTDNLGRINTRLVDRINYFMDYFPSIKLSIIKQETI